MTLADALAAAAARGLERLDAQLLLLHVLERPATDRGWLLAHDKDALAPAAQAAFGPLCERRAAGEPLAYIVGRKEFFGLDLLVDQRVLVPRPETETVVEWALEILGCHPGLDPGSTLPHTSPAWIAEPGRSVMPRHVHSVGPALGSLHWTAARPGRSAGPVRNDSLSRVGPGSLRIDSLSPRVIDLGTGSGAIALSIKKARPQAVVDAVDSSPDALEVARANARHLSLAVNFVQASWLAASGQRYDLIIGNPPYVARADPHLAALKHEPLRALAAGHDGLQDIRTIIDQAPAHLQPGGWLMLEHGWDQAEAVRGLLAAAGLQDVATRHDLAGIERCSGGRWLELG